MTGKRLHTEATEDAENGRKNHISVNSVPLCETSGEA
jgi:hypothetical protein